MKIRPDAPTVKTQTLLLAADVSRDSLSLFARLTTREGRPLALEDVVPNRTPDIEHVLAHVGALAREHGYAAVHVLCEPTGGFERLLLRIARHLGMPTALVSPERVCQLKKVESLDTSKTDKKDARVIHLAGRLGKTQTDRALPERYVLLRRLTSFHDDEVRTTSALRVRILRVLSELFPDYDRPVAFTFSKTGRVLLRERLLCPRRLVSLGRVRLLAMLRRRVPAVKGATAERLVSAAESSVRAAPPEAVADVLSRRLSALLSELEMHEGQAEQYKSEIERLGAELKEAGELPAIEGHVSGLTLFNLARIIGQTGPLSDFNSKRQLLRYAGMNLRERESGTYKGKTRLSKKGRPLLRKVLGQAVFPVLRSDRLMGPPYAERRKRMPEQKARVAAMRKLLTVLFGVYRSKRSFEAARVFTCESRMAA